MCKKNNTINEAVNEYLKNITENKFKTVNDTYLKNYISNQLYISPSNSEQRQTFNTYKELAGVVFDDRTYNFHIFPNNHNECKILSNKHEILQKELEKNLITQLSKPLNKISEESTLTLYKNLLESTIIKGNGTFPRMRNIEKEVDNIDINTKATITSEIVRLFNRYVGIATKTANYYIHPMRFTYGTNEESQLPQVGCTFREIQFHKEIRPINKAKPSKKLEFDICYPESDNNYLFHKNSGGNICFNPPVNYPLDDENNISNDEEIEDIIYHFIYFVENNENFTTPFNIELYQNNFKKWKTQFTITTSNTLTHNLSL